MINYVKVQTEILKKLVREDLTGLAYSDYNGDIWVTYDAIALRYIPDEMLFLDLYKINKTKVANNILPEEYNAIAAHRTLETIDNGKNPCRKFIVDGEEKYMQDRFVKECDSWKYYKRMFYGYCNDVLCMVVMEVMEV
jgi:hypothetical protein